MIYEFLIFWIENSSFLFIYFLTKTGHRRPHIIRLESNYFVHKPLRCYVSIKCLNICAFVFSDMGGGGNRYTFWRSEN